MQGKFLTTRSGNRKSSGTEEQDKEDQVMSMSAQAHFLSQLKPQTRKAGRNHRAWKLFLCPVNTVHQHLSPQFSQHQGNTRGKQPGPQTREQSHNVLPTSVTYGGSRRKFSDLQNLGIPKITKIKSRPLSSNSTPGYIPKITESRNLNRYLYIPVHSSILHNT